ncbi:MAG: hypothetical protein AABY13_06150, partial [Nanoarchaeota archaeon]
MFSGSIKRQRPGHQCENGSHLVFESTDPLRIIQQEAIEVGFDRPAFMPPSAFGETAVCVD